MSTYALAVASLPQVSDTDRIAAADAYIDALASHRADAVPFAPDCVRIEVGVKTGFSADHLRRSLNRGPQYRVIAATTDRDFRVDGDQFLTIVRFHTRLAGRSVWQRTLVPICVR